MAAYFMEPIEMPSAKGDKKQITREEARRRLAAAGRLSTIRYSPEEAVELSEEERAELAQLFGGDDLTALDLINIDRGPR